MKKHFGADQLTNYKLINGAVWIPPVDFWVQGFLVCIVLECIKEHSY